MTTAPKKQPIQFGPYLLLDRVNVGGMAEVWRAKSFGAGGFERILAIKRILPNIAEDEEFITMFIDEAKITVLLSHANIAQVHDMNNLQNNYYIAMEYVSGKDMRALFDRCRRRGEPAPIALTCYALALCCEGLDYAHRAKDKQGRDMNIVHRDVSPQNALLSYEGEVKVIDFGIAKAAGRNKTQAGILKGKFGYMSPEQIRGLPLDRRSDVFAMGVCLYEMLTGERLFVGDSDFSVLEKVRKVEVLPPSHFNRKIPEQLERIVMRALAKEVEDRYQYASELAEDLRAFMYSTGNIFSRKDLAAFMKATFAEEYEKERERLQEYAQIHVPEGMLAALETGYSLGPMPPPLGGSASGSSVTELPSLMPMGAAPVLRSMGSGGLPPVSGPLPPVSAPRPSGVAPPVAPRASLPSVPRVTAVAHESLNGTDEHSATVLAPGGAPPDESTNPGPPVVAPRRISGPVAVDLPTVPSRPVPLRPVTPFPAQRERPGPPVLAPNEAAARRPSAKRLPPAPREPSATFPPVPAARKSGHSISALQPGAAQNDPRLIVVLAGILALLVLGVVAAVLLRPPPTGLVIINIPDEVRGSVSLQINGETVTEKDGTPLKDWPAVRQVKVGQAVVRLTAPGYEPLLEILTVKAADPVELTKEMKKSK